MFDTNFSEKKILVTGASSGIGRQIAIDLINRNAQVYGTGRREKELKETASLSENVDAFSALPGDLTNSGYVDNAIEMMSPLDGVVANAGVAEYLPAKFITEEKIRKIFSINFDANVLLISKLLKKKKIKPGSSIVFMSSISSKLGVPGTAMYAASKAAVSAYSKVLASELASQKIRVNSICPGIVLTELVSGQSVLSEEQRGKLQSLYPLGLGTPKSVSGPALFLLSDLSSWVTGADMIVDGGNTLV